MRDKLPELTITRTETGPQGTFGDLVCGEFSCSTAELPWRDNRPYKSSIPAGTYRAELYDSPTFGMTFHIKDVPGRTWILFHAGNFSGDVDLGFRSHSEGCIMLGERIGELYKQRAIINSRVTVSEFLAAAAGHDLLVHIREQYCSSGGRPKEHVA